MKKKIKSIVCSFFLFSMLFCYPDFVFSDSVVGGISEDRQIEVQRVYSRDLGVCVEAKINANKKPDDYSSDIYVLLRSTEHDGEYRVVDYIYTREKEWTACDAEAPIGKNSHYIICRIFSSYTSWLSGRVWNQEEMEQKVHDYTAVTFDYTLDLSAPPAPKFKKIRVRKDLKIELGWYTQHNVSGYHLYKYDEKIDDYVLLHTFNHDYNSIWTDETANPGNVNRYKISSFARDAVGNQMESELSDAIEATPIPQAPTLKLRVVGKDTVKLSWNAIGYEDSKVQGYKIYRYDSTSKNYKMVKNIKGFKTITWKDTGLKTGKKYTYKITSYALDMNGNTIESKKSSSKSATPRLNRYIEHPEPYFYQGDYGNVILRTKEVSYVGGKIQFKALVLNHRVFYANKFNKISIEIYDEKNDKVIARQTFYNKSIGLGGYQTKTMTFLFDKGTKIKNYNLRYANIDVDYNYTYTYSY